MLNISDLTFSIGGRTLLSKAELRVATGEKIGLVGPNGVGKSTLFKLISGELNADFGDITLINNASVGMVRQDMPEDDTTLIDVVLSADKERTALLEEAETADDPDRIGYIYSRLSEIDAYDAPARAATILAGLGFDDAAQNTAISEFSGGWRMRVALASVLFLQPDLLLLDEPTNHLDFEAMIWLENYLQRYEKTFVIISHDRDILNKTVDRIVHLDNGQLVSYTGNYDLFERRRAEKMMTQQAMHEQQVKQKERMMKFVERFRAKASKARQAQSRLKMIEKMDIVDAVIADRASSFIFPEPDELFSPIITLQAVDAGYEPGKPVLKRLSLRIDMDDRIALLGANGNGKSTLVKLLSDRLQPMAGEVGRPAKLRIGYFSQHQTDELDLTLTPYETMQAIMKTDPEPKVRGALGKFGFNKIKADTKVNALSGGEKARLLLCMMSYHAPQILMLDEPTNHLDIDAREALIQALNNFNGAVILVSHDPHLVECVAERLWLVADGTCKPFDGDLEDYKQEVLMQRRKERSDAREEAKQKKNDRRSEKAQDEKNAKKVEKKLRELQERKSKLEQEIAQLAASNEYTKLAELNAELGNLNNKMGELEAEWLRYQ